MVSISDLLIEPKLLYFFMCLPYYVFYSFRPIYFENELEIRNEKYGTIASIISITAIISPIFWTSFADKIKRHKLILMLTTLGNCAFFLCFSTVKKDTDNKVLLAGLIIFLDTFCQYAMQPLLDARVMKILVNKFNDNAKTHYGRQRLWGTLSYGVITLVVSRLDDALSDKTFYYYLSAVTTVIFLGVAFFIIPADEPNAQPATETISEKKLQEKPTSVEIAAVPEESTLSKYGRLLSNGNYIFFLLVTFCNGFSRGVGTHYLSSFTKSSINNKSFFVGLQSWTGVVLEIILFFFTGPIVKKIGIYWLLIVAQLAMAVRMAFYAFVPTGNPDWIWPVLVVELLKGVSFACMQIPGVQIATQSAPKGLEATAIGLFSGVFAGLAPSVAALVGGYCNKSHRQLIFQVSAALAWISLVGFFIKYYFVDKKISFSKTQKK